MSTVAVLGPGAVGGALAVPLALTGLRVICVGPTKTVSAIARSGLTLERSGEVLQARPEAVEKLTEPVDLLLITVKAPALEGALARVAADAGVVLPLLNGLEHVETIRRLGLPVVAGSIGRLEAYRSEPTRIVQTTPAAVVTVGTEDAGSLLAAAGFEVRVEPDERALLWEKVARLAALAAATAETQMSVGALRDDPAWRATLETAVAEACAVAVSDGVDLTPESQWAIIDTMPASLTTSTARDVAAGRPSELDAITGGVVRAGRRLGVPCPTLESLLTRAEAARR